MGCDIHIVVERKLKGSSEWTGIWSSDDGPCRRAHVAQRDYGFFAEVASVRGESSKSLYPRNLPVDVSRLAWLRYMQSPTDHHSASHMSVQDFVAAWLRANKEPKEVRPDFAAYDLLGIDADWPEGAEYRVVFWFDN